ncbi:MAG: rhodanese-like domain-containing protein [Candidatus Limnocylindrales bacterium]
MTERRDPAETPAIDVIEADRRRRAPGDGPRPLLVDVRELDEIVAVRAEDVVVIPMSQFAQRFRELPDDQPLMIICASGGRSGMAAAFLAANGYRDAVNVAGGTQAWERNGLPVRRGPLGPGEGDPTTR